jgi:TPR repeat protein
MDPSRVFKAAWIQGNYAATVKPSSKEAVMLQVKRARQGHLGALIMFRVLMLRSLHVEVAKSSQQILVNRAEQHREDTLTLLYVAESLLFGTSADEATEESRKKGYTLLKRACWEHHPHAYYVLGYMYLRGCYAPKCAQRALIAFRIAAAGEHPGAYCALSYMFNNDNATIADAKLCINFYRDNICVIYQKQDADVLIDNVEKNMVVPPFEKKRRCH